jgi:hypothetical protein
MDFEEFLKNLLDAIIEDDKMALAELHEVAWENLQPYVRTYDEAGMLTHDKGVVVRHKNSRGEFRVSIFEKEF